MVFRWLRQQQSTLFPCSLQEEKRGTLGLFISLIDSSEDMWPSVPGIQLWVQGYAQIGLQSPGYYPGVQDESSHCWVSLATCGNEEALNNWRSDQKQEEGMGAWVLTRQFPPPALRYKGCTADWSDIMVTLVLVLTGLPSAILLVWNAVWNIRCIPDCIGLTTIPLMNSEKCSCGGPASVTGQNPKMTRCHPSLVPPTTAGPCFPVGDLGDNQP